MTRLAGASPYRVVAFAWVLVLITVSYERLVPIVFTVFLAVAFGLLIDVPVSAAERRGIPRGVGVTLVFTVLAATLIGAILVLVPSVAGEIDSLSAEHGDLGAALVDRLNEVLAGLPVDVGPVDHGIFDGSRFADAIASTDVVSRAGTVAAEVFVALFVAAWAVANPRALSDRLLGFVPPARRDGLREVTGAVERRLRAWLAGQVVLCLAVGIGSYAGFRALGVPFALVFAILAGLLEAVPTVGIFLASIPPVAITLLDDPSRALWVVAFILALQRAEDHLLVPVVMRRAVDIPQSILLLVLFSFGVLFGALGMVMAVPITAAAFTVHDVITRYHEEHPDPDASATLGPPEPSTA